MCEIDVTPILDADCEYMSASQWELGPEAGRITWRNCLEFAAEHPLITDDNRQDVRDHFAEYGAWEREEIDGWDDTHLSAMLWQEVAGDYRHYLERCDGVDEIYQADCEAGRVSGRLIIDNGRAVIYLGV